MTNSKYKTLVLYEAHLISTIVDAQLTHGLLLSL